MYLCLLFFMFISDKLQHAKYDIKKLVYLLRKIYENPQCCCGKSMKIRNTRSEIVPPIILQTLLGERGARRSMFRMPRH